MSSDHESTEPYGCDVPDHLVMILVDSDRGTYSAAISGGFHFTFYDGFTIRDPLPKKISYQPPTEEDIKKLYSIEEENPDDEDEDFDRISSGTEKLPEDFDAEKVLFGDSGSFDNGDDNEGGMSPCYSYSCYPMDFEDDK